jgi:hypothetical protein
MPLRMDQSDIACFALCSKLLSLLAHIAVERGDLEVALDFTHRAVNKAREDPAAITKRLASAVLCEDLPELLIHLGFKAWVLESLGRLDEALALDDEYLALNGRKGNADILVRRAKRCIAAGQDAQAEHILRRAVAHTPELPQELDRYSRKMNEGAFRPHALLAELLERRGIEEALVEARSFRDNIAQHLAEHEAKRTAALDETRVAAGEAIRQWREESSKARGEKKGGGKSKKKGKKKGKKKKGRKGKGKESSPAAAIEGEPPHEPVGGEAEGATAGEEATAADAEQQQAPVGESQPPDEEEEREECAIYLQDLELEDEEDSWFDEGGDCQPSVVLRCGHRFHEICGDMWCATCANKGCDVTCPKCRGAYVIVRS